MAARRKRVAGKPPEEKKTSEVPEKVVEKQKSVQRVDEDTQEKEKKIVEEEPELEFPFKEKEIPIVEEKEVVKGT